MKRQNNKYLKMLYGQEEFLPKLISSCVTPSSSFVNFQLENDDQQSNRENYRKRGIGNRRLNFSAAWKIYTGNSDSMFC